MLRLALAMVLWLVATLPGSTAGDTLYMPLVSVPNAHVRLVAAINRVRAEHKLPPLVEHAGLSAAAQEHADDMLDQGFFAHDSIDGTPWWQRIQHYYRPWSRLGEVIAGGQSNAAAALDAWLNSPPHRATLLSPNFEHMGVGVAWPDPQSGNRGPYWVVDLGKP